MTGESIFNIFTKSVLQDLLKKLKIEFTNSWKKDKLVELLCERDIKKALNKMTTEQLKVVLGEMNLSQSGKKSLLIDRILDGEVGGGNNNGLLGDAVAQAALQEFKELIDTNIYEFMDEDYGGFGDFEGIHYDYSVLSDDHRHVVEITAVFSILKVVPTYSTQLLRREEGSVINIPQSP